MRTAAHTPSAAEAAASEARAQLDARLEELDRFVAEDQESPPPTAIAREALRTQLCELAAAWREHTGAALPFPFVTVTWAGELRCEWDTERFHVAWIIDREGESSVRVIEMGERRAQTRSLVAGPTLAGLMVALDSAGVSAA